MTTKEKIIKFLSIGNNVQIIGSFTAKTLKYKNDIDLNENVKITPKAFYNKIKSKFEEANLYDNIWITDFKLGIDDRGQGIHWSKKDIKNGYKIIRKKKYQFVDCLNDKSIIKMDVTAFIDDRFYDFSNNYFIIHNGKSTDSFVGDVITRLLMDYYDNIDQVNFYKALKRLHSIYALERNKEKIIEIETFLNSSVGKLNRQLSNLKTISLLMNNNFKPVPIQLIISNLKVIKSKLPPNYAHYIDSIIKQSSKSVFNKLINELIGKLSVDVNIDTFGFIMTINNILK
jgi:hypothetical protein